MSRLLRFLKPATEASLRHGIHRHGEHFGVLAIGLSLILFAVFNHTASIRPDYSGFNASTGTVDVNYSSTQVPTFVVSAGNANSKITAKVMGRDGTATPALTSIQAILDKPGEFKVSVKPQREIAPGKYTIQATIVNQNKQQVVSQDFTWGVLAINLDKSTYRPRDNAHIGMAVLDDKGVTICDAQTSLEITSPDGSLTTLSTTDKTIIVSDTCVDKSVTNNADYIAKYIPKQLGDYSVKLTAHTKNGMRTVHSMFTVNTTASFISQRTDTAMRLYPASSYDVNLQMTSASYFTGTLEERVPQNFVVTDPKLTIRSFSGVIREPSESALRIDVQANDRFMRWDNVTLLPGETAIISYTYKPPFVSPEFYHLGPAKATHPTNGTTFEEPRAWQLASDAAGDVIVLWDTANGAIPAGWTCVSCTVSDDFYQRFPRGSSSYAGTGGGPESHTHTYTQSSVSAPSAVTSNTNTFLGSRAVGSPTHNDHIFPSPTIGSTDIKPPYKNLRFIKASNPLSLPLNAIVMFDVPNISSLPANFTSYTALNDPSSTGSAGNGVYLRGETTNTTGGTATHIHTRSAVTSGTGTTVSVGTSNNKIMSNGTHTHTVAAGNTTTENNDPSFITVVFARVTQANEALPNGMLAFFDDTTLPAGWTQQSTIGGNSLADRLIKGSLAAGTIGGRISHSHGGSQVITSGAPSTTIMGPNSGLANTQPASSTHTHNVTFTISDESSMPNYRDVIIGKFATVNITGTVYSDEGTTALGSQPVKIALNGGAQRTVTAAANGTFTLPMPDPGAGGVFTVWINSNGGNMGATVTRTNGGAISGLDIYQNRLVTSHEDSGPLSNSNIAVCDKTTGVVCTDSDLHFDESGGNLTVDNDWRLFVDSGKSFAPGGSLTLSPGGTAASMGGDLKFGSSSSTLNMGVNALNVGGDWINTAGGNFTKSASQTTTMTGTVAGLTIDASTKNFENLTFSGGASGTWAFTPAATTVNIDGNFNMSTNTGTVTAPSGTLNVGGNWTRAASGATFTHNSGTVAFNGTTTGKTINPGASNFNNVTFNGSGGAWSPLTNTVTILGNLTMTNGTFDTSNGTANVVVNGSVVGTSGIINMSSANTFTQRVSTGRNFGTSSGSSGWTFNNLTFSNSSGSPAVITTQTGGSGDITINNNLLVSVTGDTASTTLNAGNRTWRLVNANNAEPFNMDQAGGGLTGNTSTFEYTGDNDGGNVMIENATYNNLTLGGAVGEVYTPEGSTTATGNLLVNANATLGGSQNITVNGNVSGSGTISLAGGIFLQRVAAAQNFGTTSGSNNWSFNDLRFENSSGTNRTITVNSTGSGNITTNGVLSIGNASDSNTTILDNETNDRDINANGNVTITNRGSMTASSSASFTMGDSYNNSGTFTSGTGRVVFDAITTGKTINAGSSSFYNVDFNGSGGGWTVQTNPATMTGDLQMIAGTLGSSTDITVNGNVQCSGTCGTINVGGTFTQSASSNKNFGTNVNIGTNWTFNNLTFDANSGSPTITFNGTGMGQTIINGVLALTKSGTSLVVNDGTNNRIIDVNGDVSIASGTTLQAPSSASFTVGGSWANAGGFTHNSGTVTFDASTTGKTINAGSSSFYNVTFNNAAGDWSPRTSAMVIANNLLMTAGTLGTAGDTSDITVNGSATGTTGAINITASGRTFTQRVASSKNFGTTSGNTNWAFANLIFSNSSGSPVTITTQTGGGGTVTVSGNLHVSASGDSNITTLDAGNRTWRLANPNGGNPFDMDQAGGGLTANLSTFEYTGDNDSGNVTIENATYNNLTLGGAVGESYDPEGSTTIAGNLLLNTNGTLIGTQNITLNGHANGAGTVALTGGIFLNRVSTAQDFGTISGSNNWTFNNLTFENNSGSNLTVTMNPTGSGSTIINGTLTVGNASDSNTTTLDAETNDRSIDANSDVLITSKGSLSASSSATFTIAGNYQNNGVFTAGTGTVTFDSGSGGKTLGGSMTSTNKFHNLTFNNASGAWGFGAAPVDIGNNLTVTAGAVTAPSTTATVSGNYSNNGSFAHNSGTVLFNATSGGKTLSGSMTGSSKFNNLAFNGSGGAWSFGANSAEIANDFTILNGTVTAPSATLTIANNYANSGTFTHNSGTVVFNATTSGKTVAAGTSSPFNHVSFNGAGGGWTIQTNPVTVSGDLLVINGTVNSTVDITANGNVQCSGTCGTLNAGNTFTQSVSSNKNFGTNVATGTNWSFNNLTFDASSGAPTITFNGTGTGQTIINGNLSLTKTGTSLTVNNSTNNRAIDANGDVSITNGTTLQAAASASFTVAGSWANAGTFTHSSGTVTFDASSSKTINPGNSSFYNITFNNAAGDWSPRTSTLTAAGDLTMTAGTLGTAGDTADIVVNGNATGAAGIINITANRLFTQRVASAKSFGSTTPGANWTFNNLTFSNSNGSATPVTVTTNSGTGTMVVTGIMRVGASGDATGATTTFNAGNRSWTLPGTSGNPFQILASPAGALTGGTSTFNFTGNNGSGNTTVQAAQYHRLVINNASEIFNASGATSADNDLTVTAGNYIIGNNDLTIGSSGVANSGSIIVASGAALTQAAPATTHIRSSSGGNATIGGAGNPTFYNLTFDPTVGSSPTFTLGNGVSQTITINGNLNVGNGSNGAIVTAAANDPIVDVNGDVAINASGTLVASDSAAFTAAGSWTNGGTFTHNSGTITFDAIVPGKTIVSGGIGAGKDFGKVIFDHSNGGWTIQTDDMKTALDLTITNIGVLTLASGRTLEVGGTYSVCGNCTSNTTWTGSTLFLNSGSAYMIGAKTNNAEIYGTLQIGANTDIRQWNSSADTVTVSSSGSLYSQDHGDLPGNLNIYGDYHVVGTDYWQYDTDFDGTALTGGNERQAIVRIETGAGRGVTVDSTKTLTAKGGGEDINQFTDVDRIGESGNYQLVNDGTANIQESKITNPSFSGGTWAPFNTVVSGHTVSSGTLTVDWYLGAHVVDLDTPSTNIDTTGTDITVAETSGSPAPTVFKMASGSWGSGASAQTADSGSNGKIAQPNTDNALRVREYSQTSGGVDYYQYNITVAGQPVYAAYDYQRDYGKYITSLGNTGSSDDQVIGASWYRDVIATENAEPTINGSVTDGTWYGGMSTAILTLWDTADGAAPSGWTCVSCTDGDPFYQRFLRAAPNYGGTGGGSESVAHNLSSPNAAAGVSFGAISGGTSVASSGHTHTWDFGAGDDTTSADIKPPYKNLQVLRGPTSGPAAWPVGIITPFRTTTAPTGWTAYTALDGIYPRGENTNTTGGAATHSHDSSPLTSGSGSGTESIGCSSGCSTAASSGHTHTLAATALPSANNDPLHVKVRFMKHTDTSPPPMQDMIGLFDHTTFPAGYILVSDSSPYQNNLLRGATSGIETASGSATHNHGGSLAVTSSAPVESATATGTGGGVNVATSGHTHNVTYAIDNANSIPNYADVVVARYRPNLDPADPAALAQKKTNDTVIISGGWINETSVKFTATVSDPDVIPQQLQLCVEKKDTGTAFDDTEDLCGAAVEETGTGSVDVSVTITGLSPDEYRWQARVKDQDSAYSAWLDYDTSDINTRDFGVDTTAPGTATVYDNTNLDTQPFDTDTDQNADGSLSTLSATWGDFDASTSGINRYEYSIGTSPGATDTANWTNNSGRYVRVSALTVQTGKLYYFNVRAVDNAGNTSNVVSSNGQLVTPTLTFDIDVDDGDVDTSPPYTVNFGGLTAGNIATSPKKIWVDFETNGVAGGKIYVAGSNSGLRSVATGSDIVSATANLATAPSGFGAQGSSSTQSSGGPFTTTSPYDGTGDNVGVLATTFQSIFSTSNPVIGGRGSFLLKAKPSDLTPASNDYSDTLIIIAAGTY